MHSGCVRVWWCEFGDPENHPKVTLCLFQLWKMSPWINGPYYRRLSISKPMVLGWGIPFWHLETWRLLALQSGPAWGVEGFLQAFQPIHIWWREIPLLIIRAKTLLEHLDFSWFFLVLQVQQVRADLLIFSTWRGSWGICRNSRPSYHGQSPGGWNWCAVGSKMNGWSQ